jgi:hypothetical protein
MRAAGASILRDTSTGLLSCVNGSVHSVALRLPYRAHLSSSYNLDVAGSANSFIGQNFRFWDRFEVSHFDSAVSKVEHAPDVPAHELSASIEASGPVEGPLRGRRG